MVYIIERLDIVSGEWNYMNSYETYSEASEALELMVKRYRGSYRISVGEAQI